MKLLQGKSIKISLTIYKWNTFFNCDRKKDRKWNISGRTHKFMALFSIYISYYLLPIYISIYYTKIVWELQEINSVFLKTV